jgi:hypothetical protein
MGLGLGVFWVFGGLDRFWDFWPIWDVQLKAEVSFRIEPGRSGCASTPASGRTVAPAARSYSQGLSPALPGFVFPIGVEGMTEGHTPGAKAQILGGL